MKHLVLFLAMGFGAQGLSAKTILLPSTGSLPEIDDPKATIDIPVYDKKGKKIKTKKVQAKDVWPAMDDWSDQVKKKHRGRGPKVREGKVFDRDLGKNIDEMQIPQDVDQGQDLDKQIDRAKRWQPTREVQPQKLTSSLSRVFGNNATFGAFQNGGFSSEGDSKSVRVSQSFSAGGVIFGNRISIINQTTNSNSTSRTTRSDVKVFDQSIFVSNDGSVNANKSLTRSKEASKVFVLGIIPVRVTGSVSGTIGANLNYKAQGLSIEGSVAPFLNTRGRASAGIDILIASAGVEGSLTFLNNTLTSRFKAAVNPAARSLEAALNVRNDFNALSGNISIFAKIRRLFRRDKKFSKTIFSFAGINQSNTLIDESVTARL